MNLSIATVALQENRASCKFHPPVVQVKPGLVTVIAGPLISGKSEFALEIASRLGKKTEFRTAICLTENQVLQFPRNAFSSRRFSPAHATSFPITLSPI